MLTHGLSEEQVRDVLARAEEIQSRSSAGTYDSVIAAAEEAGLTRSAITQAIQERVGAFVESPPVGQLVFAKGEKGRYFPAEVVSTSGVHVSIRFLNGSEQTVAFDALRPLTLLPGESVVCPWPDWGFWTCSVVSFDAARRRVRVTDNWGSGEKTFDLDEVFINSPRVQNQESTLSWLLISALTVGGGIVGSVLTWLAMR